MKFKDFIVKTAIQPRLKSMNKGGVIQELVHALVSAGEIPDDAESEILGKVLQREELGSTGIGRGVAAPHAKSPAAKRVLGTVGVSANGVDFASLDGEPAYLFFLLVSPPESGQDHLRALEHTSRQLRQDLFIRLLRQSETTREIYQILEEADESDGEAFI